MRHFSPSFRFLYSFKSHFSSSIYFPTNHISTPLFNFLKIPKWIQVLPKFSEAGKNLTSPDTVPDALRGIASIPSGTLLLFYILYIPLNSRLYEPVLCATESPINFPLLISLIFVVVNALWFIGVLVLLRARAHTAPQGIRVPETGCPDEAGPIRFRNESVRVSIVWVYGTGIRPQNCPNPIAHFRPKNMNEMAPNFVDENRENLNDKCLIFYYFSNYFIYFLFCFLIFLNINFSYVK